MDATRTTSRCQFPDCGGAHLARGYCRPHYDQYHRGLPLNPKPVPERALCSLDGCDTHTLSGSLCGRHSALKMKYSLTMERMRELEDVSACSICGAKRDARFAIDHDHACCSGAKSCGDCVRGVLCSQCNLLLGDRITSDWLARAWMYLDSTTANG